MLNCFTEPLIIYNMFTNNMLIFSYFQIVFCSINNYIFLKVFNLQPLIKGLWCISLYFCFKTMSDQICQSVPPLLLLSCFSPHPQRVDKINVFRKKAFSLKRKVMAVRIFSPFVKIIV